MLFTTRALSASLCLKNTFTGLGTGFCSSRSLISNSDSKDLKIRGNIWQNAHKISNFPRGAFSFSRGLRVSFLVSVRRFRGSVHRWKIPKEERSDRAILRVDFDTPQNIMAITGIQADTQNSHFLSTINSKLDVNCEYDCFHIAVSVIFPCYKGSKSNFSYLSFSRFYFNLVC